MAEREARARSAAEVAVDSAIVGDEVGVV